MSKNPSPLPDDDESKSPSMRSPRSQASSSSTASSHHPALSILLGGRYRLVRRLGGGAFGEVYQGIELSSQEPVAIKLEPLATSHQLHLHHEARLYHYLTRSVVTVGIPRVRWFGREGEFNVMAMDLLGPSLEDLFEFCSRKFDVKTVCMLGMQMIARLEFMHAMCYLHRDLKPENFAMGMVRKAHHVYIIDLGLAKRYCDVKTREHIPYIEGKNLTGTARYVSINTHLGRQQARRDDIESVALILIYFLRGSLPWQGIRAPTKQEKYDRIKQQKLQISIGDLCQGHPTCFHQFLAYSRQLEFTEQPHYKRCMQFFERYMKENELAHDYQFAWLAKANSLNMLTDSASMGDDSSPRMRRRRKTRDHSRGDLNVSQLSVADSGQDSLTTGGFALTSPLKENP